jgi:hypothetical protein
VGVDEVLGVDELVAGGDEGLGRPALAESVDGEAGHRVDDHGGVGGVLAGRVGELLDGLDRLGQQLVSTP